ncbi:MAG: TOTE conflict system archaeo-eukaryotic primase domain-containing protein [Terriglobales bacterium]
MQVQDGNLKRAAPPQTVEERLKAALKECAKLRTENENLQARLADSGQPKAPGIAGSVQAAERANQEIVSRLSPPERKLALFRQLFRGREDVYAVRWEGKNGKSGYSPAAIVDWRALRNVEPEQRRKVMRHTRSLVPLNDEAVRDHLQGRQTLGIYPLLTDESCWLLAVDFDKKSWQADVAAFAATCQRCGVPVLLERSRSGNGAHAWMFFDRPVMATDARKLGCALLTRTAERRHEIGLDSYDRLFPNQDTMPKGGFGNLIALPLQKVPREHDNSVFLDSELKPCVDQWRALSAVARIPADNLAGLIHAAAPEGNVVGVRVSLTDEEDGSTPWLLTPSRKRREQMVTEPLPAKVRIVLGDLAYIAKEGLPSAMLDRLRRIAAFQNPEFYRAQAMRLSTYGKPRVISCGEDFPDHIGLPRGCVEEAAALLAAHGIALETTDERFAGAPLNVAFLAELLPAQQEAVNATLSHDAGVIHAPTAFGKTVVGAALIAQRSVNTLVLVHRRQLMDQWTQRLETFLNLPSGSVGQIGGGRSKRTNAIDVAVIQSLQRKGEVQDLVAEYGQIIVDECHHLSAFSFEQVLKRAKAKYIVGLTATPTRRDGHHPIIYMQCGPIRFSMSAKKAAELAPFEHKVFPRNTAFQATATGEISIHELYAAMIRDDARNSQIVEDIQQVLRAGRSPLVLTARTEHLEYLLTGLVAADAPNVFVLKGGQGKKQRAKLTEGIAAIAPDEPRVILATGSYVGEGFDDARLDTLFLAMPISWRGTLQQYVGRLHRVHANKREVHVYDYVDSQVPMLGRMFNRRAAGYHAIGYAVGAHPENV